MSEWFEAARPVRAKRKHDEQDHQAALFTWARLNAKKYPGLDLMFASVNGTHNIGAATQKQRIITGARLKKSGMKKGVPDVFLPVARGKYHGLFIELKKIGGKLSEEQLTFGIAVENQGYQWDWCEGWEAAVEVIEEYYAS